MKLWGGRFQNETEPLMRQFNDSFRFDRRLYAVDIQGSHAYAAALARVGLLTKPELEEIEQGLQTVLKEFEAGKFKVADSDEDIHTAVERRLTELVGPVAGKLHTGRSRNDQVAVDLRLYMMETIESVLTHIAGLQTAILIQAEANMHILMPGFTHLQRAQPILFSHWLMSYFWMFERDKERLVDSLKRTARSPLGAGALAGNPFGVDRQQIADDLGMRGIMLNSLDAVSDRDFVAEFLFIGTLLSIHISRLAEDLIIYSNPSFGYIHLDEAYATGSSLMPQKRNPDALELARGKTGRMLGALTTLLTVLKGLPSTYNKDLQEDKEALFDAVDTLALTVPILTGVVKTLIPDEARMTADLDESMLATDIAEYLVLQGLPFREAHHVVGQVIQLAEQERINLSALSLAQLQVISSFFQADIEQVFDFQQSVEQRNSIGGTAPEAVRQQIVQAKEVMLRE